MSTLTLVAPIKGWVAPLEEVPDPVFSERLLGDGLAIDPTDATVHAPCDGVVASVARHAVTLRAANGAEILIHVGLETVALHGQGFVTHVREGKLVKAGEPLITFDLDFLASRAKSLISPVIVTNGDAFAIVRRSTDRETGIGEFLMELRPLSEAPASEKSGAPAGASREAVVPLAHGIHARPAAVLANAAKRLAAEVTLTANGRTASAKSIVALMSLGLHKDQRVTITAQGADAQAAVNAIAELIASGLGESAAETASAPPVTPSVTPAASLSAKSFRGVCGAPGLAIGKAVQFRSADSAVVEDGNGIAHEAAALGDAIASVRTRIERLSMTGDRARRDILGAHVALLDDPELQHAAHKAIQNSKSAAFAWRAAIRGYTETLGKIDDPRLKERVGDLLDLERQVIAAISGEATERTFAPDSILIADELLPSELVGLGTIAGFCTARGGPTSHVAIIAAGMDVPALVGAGDRILSIAEGTQIILDASAGLLHIEPDAQALREAHAALERQHAKESAALAHAREECRMADGTRIEIFANLGAGADEAKSAIAAGAEGCGLLRTEFLFLDRATPPSEDEQAQMYQGIASALEGRPLIIRTFDIGGDKPVPYLPFPAEENPALGLRGVRAGLWRSDLLNAQLGAILRVKPQCRIMLPMVASLEELRTVRAMLDGLSRARAIETRIPLGVMVETPASAVLSEQLAREADFFSIGTNDLTQYTLAMDRGHAQLGPQIDAFHPAVLGLIARAAEGGRAHKRLVAVCGGLAADPLAAAILIGLGIEELSMPLSAIAIVKATIRALSMEACRAAANEALKQDSPAAVRAVAAKYLPAS